MSNTSSDDFADDLLRGVSQISTFIGESERRTYYKLEQKLLPGYKRGGNWESRKSAIRADAERRMQEAMTS